MSSPFLSFLEPLLTIYYGFWIFELCLIYSPELWLSTCFSYTVRVFYLCFTLNSEARQTFLRRESQNFLNCKSQTFLHCNSDTKLETESSLSITEIEDITYNIGDKRVS